MLTGEDPAQLRAGSSAESESDANFVANSQADQYQVPGHVYGTMPHEDLILQEIRNILATADLMTVTKKMVRKELEGRFGVDMTPKKEYIHSATEAVLSGQL